MSGAVIRAEVGDIEPANELRWLEPAVAVALLTPESHRWAVEEWSPLTRVLGLILSDGPGGSVDDGMDRGSTPNGAPGASLGLPQLRDFTTDALKYWELRRVFYNVLLAVIVVGHFIASWPESRTSLTVDGFLGLFLLAVLANIAYSAVYVADVFIQVSGFRESRMRWRWVLLAVGFAFAGVLTHFMSSGIFGGGGSMG